MSGNPRSISRRREEPAQSVTTVQHIIEGQRYTFVSRLPEETSVIRLLSDRANREGNVIAILGPNGSRISDAERRMLRGVIENRIAQDLAQADPRSLERVISMIENIGGNASTFRAAIPRPTQTQDTVDVPFPNGNFVARMPREVYDNYRCRSSANIGPFITQPGVQVYRARDGEPYGRPLTPRQLEQEGLWTGRSRG